jgi:2'-5' RNA ligase
MQPGDRLICTLVRPISVNDTFITWPLHVTIVPWFRVDDTTNRIKVGLMRALSPISSFTATGGETTHFGPRHNRPAVLIVEPTPFHAVEQRVRTYLHKKRAWLVDETTKRPHTFRPHVTLQKNDQLQVGEAFQCDRVYIVEQKGDHKAVVGEVPFQHEQTAT